jgi:hypothetical protein
VNQCQGRQVPALIQCPAPAPPSPVVITPHESRWRCWMDRDGPKLETLLYSRTRPTGLDRASSMHDLRVPGSAEDMLPPPLGAEQYLIPIWAQELPTSESHHFPRSLSKPRLVDRAARPVRESAPSCFLGTRCMLIFLLEKVNNIQLFPSTSMLATLRWRSS